MPSRSSPQERLLVQARALLPLAWAPHSRFPVGAVLEDSHGGTYPGVNVESASLGLTMCAERVALFAAIARGARSFGRIAIVAATLRPALPCGACRQVLLEHAPELSVVVEDASGRPEVIALRDLLPRAFLRYEATP